MLIGTLKTRLSAVLASTILFLPALQAQPLDKRIAASETWTVPLDDTVLRPVHVHNADTQEQVGKIVESLTVKQQEEIKAVLKANAPGTRGAVNLESTTDPATGAQPSREAPQGLNPAEKAQIDRIIVGIQAVLTESQLHAFNDILPPRPNEEEEATSGQEPPSAVTSGALSACYSAYVFDTNYLVPLAYASEVYGLAHYMSSSDPIAYELYELTHKLNAVLAPSAQSCSYAAFAVSSNVYGPCALFYNYYSKNSACAGYYLAATLSDPLYHTAYTNGVLSYLWATWTYAASYATPAAEACAY